jgi:carbon storage regulator
MGKMLVVSRKTGEGIVISEEIRITVIEAGKDKVKIGIDAPKNVRIVREEIFATEKQNMQASRILSPDIMERLLKEKE